MPSLRLAGRLAGRLRCRFGSVIQATTGKRIDLRVGQPRNLRVGRPQLDVAERPSLEPRCRLELRSTHIAKKGKSRLRQEREDLHGVAGIEPEKDAL